MQPTWGRARACRARVSLRQDNRSRSHSPRAPSRDDVTRPAPPTTLGFMVRTALHIPAANGMRSHRPQCTAPNALRVRAARHQAGGLADACVLHARVHACQEWSHPSRSDRWSGRSAAEVAGSSIGATHASASGAHRPRFSRSSRLGNPPVRSARNRAATPSRVRMVAGVEEPR